MTTVERTTFALQYFETHTLLDAEQRKFEAEELTYWGIGKTDTAFMNALYQWRNSVGLPPHRSIPTGTVFTDYNVNQEQV